MIWIQPSTLYWFEKAQQKTLFPLCSIRLLIKNMRVQLKYLRDAILQKKSESCGKNASMLAISGPYWAALSHPNIDYETTIRIYSDVHMLSHLVGSSNRADIARLSELELELADALEKISH